MKKIVAWGLVIFLGITASIGFGWFLWPPSPTLPDYGSATFNLSTDQSETFRCSNDAMAQIAKPSTRIVQKEICEKEANENRSRTIELIDQRRASDATVASVWIAVWQSRVNVIGTIFGLFTLISAITAALYAAVAARETKRAADYAGESHFAFTRVEDAYLVITMSRGMLITGTDAPRIRIHVEISNVGRSTALVDRFSTDVGGLIILDGITIAANETVTLPAAVHLTGLEKPGESFDGTLFYHTALNGRREVEFIGTIMSDSSTAAGLYAMVMRKELPITRAL